MSDHLQIKGDPIEDFDIGHHKSAHNLHGTYFLSLRALPAAFNFYEASWWHFLLMLGIQARIIPWTITNNIGVDAKRDFLI